MVMSQPGTFVYEVLFTDVVDVEKLFTLCIKPPAVPNPTVLEPVTLSAWPTDPMLNPVRFPEPSVVTTLLLPTDTVVPLDINFQKLAFSVPDVDGTWLVDAATAM